MKTLTFRIVLIAAIWGVLISLFAPLATPVAQAAAPYIFTDLLHIKGPDGTIYTLDRTQGINTNIFVSTKKPAQPCQMDGSGVNNAYKKFGGVSLIDFPNYPGDNIKEGYLHDFGINRTPNAADTIHCVQQNSPDLIKVDVGTNRNVYIRLDKFTIQAIPNPANYKDNSQDSRIYKSGDGTQFSATVDGCKSFLNVYSNFKNINVTLAVKVGSSTDIGPHHTDGACDVQNAPGHDFTLGNPDNRNHLPLQGDTSNPTDPTSPGGTAETIKPTCDVDSLTWVVCPIISLAQQGITTLSGMVKDQLKYRPLTAANDLQPFWAKFRDLANIFFVLIFFIVIFGTSMGLDNYTVKKVLPRLIAAAVLVQFSYFLVGFMVDISNVLGAGIDSIMAAAVPVAVRNGNPGSMVALGAVEVVAGLGGAVAFSPFLAGFAVPLLLTLASAILSLIAVFVTLQIRIMIIDFLVILAPIAFLLWVLPNTEKYFNMWRETLIKLLLMYPIIVLLLAVANLFSVVVTSGSDAPNLNKLMASVAPIFAFFLIPATFKMASGALMMGSGLVSKAAGRGHKGLAGMKDTANENRRESGLNRLNDRTKAGLAKTSLGSRLAQKQAGFGMLRGAPSQRRITGALESNDKQRLSLASFAMRDDDPDKLEKTAMSPSSDEYQRRAAIEGLAKKNATGHLGRVLQAQYGGKADDPEWKKATEGSYSDLKKKAPHLVPGGGYDNLSAADLAGLNGDGIAGLSARRSNLSGDTLKNFDTKLGSTFAKLNSLPTTMATVKPAEMGGLNAIASSGGYTQLGTPVAKPATVSMTMPDVSEATGTSDPVVVQQVANTIIQQQQKVQQILSDHAETTGTSVGIQESRYFSDKPANATYKAQVDIANAHNVPVQEIINATTPHLQDPANSPETDQPGDDRSIS